MTRATPPASVTKALFDAGRTSWPHLPVEAAAFARYVADRLEPGESLDGARETRSIGDLYLACACAAGDREAHAALDRQFLSKLPTSLARLDSSKGFADEVVQALREKLLVGATGGPGKLADYSGKGPLMNWLRAAVIRTALNLRGRRAREIPSDDANPMDLTAGPEDPELTFLKSRYRPAFNSAFRAALDSLSARDKNVLRLYLVERKNVGAIGRIYQVDRTTVTRWIVRARKALLDRTRNRMIASLGLGERETDSLMRVLRSRLDVSITRVLRGAT